jgi:hypothetical protein
MQRVLDSIKHRKKTYAAAVAGVIIGAGLLVAPIIAPAANAISIGGPSDCDSNAIIKCGAHSTGALMSAYQSSAYVRGVYAYFGISQSDMAHLQSTNVAGHVDKDGKVYVDNRSNPVATGAVTGGRQDMPGSHKVNQGGAVFYVRPPSVSFQQNSLPAFVAVKNGQFQFAVIASCGNAVRAQAVKQAAPAQHSIGQAKPVSKPQAKQQQRPAPKPAPTPAPTMNQSQSQAQSQSQSVNVTSTNTNTVNNTQAAPEQPAAQAQTSVAAQPATTQPEQPAQVETSSQPTSLVNTGPGEIVGLFVAASAAGSFIFRRFILHRLADY